MRFGDRLRHNLVMTAAETVSGVRWVSFSLGTLSWSEFNMPSAEETVRFLERERLVREGEPPYAPPSGDLPVSLVSSCAQPLSLWGEEDPGGGPLHERTCDE